MDSFKRDDVKKVALPGRVIQNAVGKNAFCESANMSVGFAHYSIESGVMEPHHHAEETIYVVDAVDGWVRYGSQKDNLGEKIKLESGMLLHFPEFEWHAFGFGEGGFVDIIFIYGQVDNNRPEDKK